MLRKWKTRKYFLQGSPLQPCMSKVLINSWAQTPEYHRITQFKLNHSCERKKNAYFIAFSILDSYLASRKSLHAFTHRTGAGIWDSILCAAELTSRGPFHVQKNLASMKLKYAYLIRGTTHWGIHTCVKYRLELAEPQHALMNLLPNFIYQELVRLPWQWHLAKQDSDIEGQIWQPLNCKTNQLIEIR